MGKLIQFNMMTVDGFFEGINKEIDWHNVDGEFNDYAVDQLDSAAALIFGRKTYELMAGYWPSQEAETNDPVVAEKMNTISKVVFSSTLNKPDWNNTRLYKNNVEKVVSDLKKNTDKDIFVFGSANLSEALIRFKLFDEFHIMLNPVILGKGIPLFRNKSGRINLTLYQTRVFKSGNILLRYLPKY